MLIGLVLCSFRASIMRETKKSLWVGDCKKIISTSIDSSFGMRFPAVYLASLSNLDDAGCWSNSIYASRKWLRLLIPGICIVNCTPGSKYQHRTAPWESTNARPTIREVMHKSIMSFAVRHVYDTRSELGLGLANTGRGHLRTLMMLLAVFGMLNIASCLLITSWESRWSYLLLMRPDRYLPSHLEQNLSLSLHVVYTIIWRLGFIGAGSFSPHRPQNTRNTLGYCSQLRNSEFSWVSRWYRPGCALNLYNLIIWSVDSPSPQGWKCSLTSLIYRHWSHCGGLNS